MTDIFEATRVGNDQYQFSVEFLFKNISRTVSRGFYSGLREANENSSFPELG